MESQFDEKKWDRAAIKIPNILLPKEGVNLTKWSVVACDQYTSQKEYWENVKKIVGSDPSTFNLIYPEVYLEEPEDEKVARIKNVRHLMNDYLSKGMLVEHKSCIIFVDRKTSHATSRKGMILALDLENYDYNKGSKTLIRSTEGTIVERLPPRIRIREGATIELPHIMVLIDDPEKKVIEPIFNELEKVEKVYDFELMLNGGHIKGYKIEKEDHIYHVLNELEKLANPKTFVKKYGLPKTKETEVLLFAMGDGNHSFATAKAVWEGLKANIKDSERLKNHPARYALVEVVNVHDEGLNFEPIHRVVFDVDFDETMKEMKAFYLKFGSSFDYKKFSDKKSMERQLIELRKDKKIHAIGFVSDKEFGVIIIKNPRLNLEVGTLQNFLDDFVKRKGTKIDYVHGDDAVESLSKGKNIGFFLPVMDKKELFRTVILDGALPRKTFSMGEADEKRFYLEARKITQD